VVGKGGEDGEKRLERLGAGGLLLRQANDDEEVGLVPVRLTALAVADGPVAELRAALPAVLAWGRSVLRGRCRPGEGHRRENDTPDATKVPHAVTARASAPARRDSRSGERPWFEAHPWRIVGPWSHCGPGPPLRASSPLQGRGRSAQWPVSGSNLHHRS